MIVVADTTPLISLLEIKYLHLLSDLFERVIIPEAVLQELVSDTRFEEEATQIRSAPYILPTVVKNQHSVEYLQRVSGLDAGESQAIVLSDELHADLLLMDEALGRKVARNMGLPIMGTLGMLKAAYHEGLLSSGDVRSCLAEMQSCGRFISTQLVQEFLASLEEEK